MVVTARASDRQAQNSAAEGVDSIVPVVGEQHSDDFRRQLLILVVDRGGSKISQRPQILAFQVWQFVRSELKRDKSVVRNIGIERFNDPVSVAPSVRVWRIRGLRGWIVLAITDDIHPVPRPTLSIMWRGKQPLNEIFIGCTRRIVFERLYFFIRRFVAEKIDVGALNQSAPIGGWRRI